MELRANIGLVQELLPFKVPSGRVIQAMNKVTCACFTQSWIDHTCQQADADKDGNLTLAEFGDFMRALQNVSQKLAGDVAQEEAPQSPKSIARRQRIAKLAEHNLNDEVRMIGAQFDTY